MTPGSLFLIGVSNLPELDWTAGAQLGNILRVYFMFTEVLATFGLRDSVFEPTRYNAVLDLLLLNDSNIVTSIMAYFEISDQSAVVSELNVSGVPDQVQVPRKILMYQKGSFNVTSTELDVHFPTFRCLSESRCPGDLWFNLYDKMLKLVETSVPSRFPRRRN